MLCTLDEAQQRLKGAVDSGPRSLGKTMGPPSPQQGRPQDAKALSVVPEMGGSVQTTTTCPTRPGHPPGSKICTPKLTAGKEQGSLPSHAGVASGPPAGRKHGGYFNDLIHQHPQWAAHAQPGPPSPGSQHSCILGLYGAGQATHFQKDEGCFSVRL